MMIVQLPLSEAIMSGHAHAERLCSRPVNRLALIGNSLPRRCGLATFTSDCFHALTASYPELAVDVYAMTDRAGGYSYPPEVRMSIDQNSLSDYKDVASEIKRSGADLLWLQHEFGIFGGPAGAYILTLLDLVSIPVVITLHTILADPNDEQRAVMQGLIERASTLVVMAEHGRALLVDVYGADRRQIEVIPHGVPDRPFNAGTETRRREHLQDHDVILTFGLLSPNKGIEHMIEALPTIVERFPAALYLIVGATHPHLVASQGEVYRNQLKGRAAELGVADHIRWVDGFLGTDELLDLLGAADIYVTPYLNPAQITSGTLAYAVGLGKPVISTPYVHARELLGDGVGRLVPFANPQALGAQAIDLLEHPEARRALERRAYALGRTMIWPRLAEAMMRTFRQIAVPSRPLCAVYGQ